MTSRPRTWSLLLCIISMLSLMVGPGTPTTGWASWGPARANAAEPTSAGTPFDIRGKWRWTSIVGDERYKKTLTIKDQDFRTGKVTGTMLSNGDTQVITGTVTGDQVVLDVRKPGTDYRARATGTVETLQAGRAMAGTYEALSRGETSSFSASAGPAPAIGEAATYDVRGRWEWTFSPADCKQDCPSYDGIVNVKLQDPVTGQVRGTYRGPERRTRPVQGSTSGDTMTVDLEDDGHPASGTLRVDGGQLIFDGTIPSEDTKVHGILARPVTPISVAGGSRPSATMVTCHRDMTVPQGSALLRCNALVSDSSAQPDSRTPTGLVRWTTEVGQLSSGTCDLVPPPLGGTASCQVTLGGSSTDIPIGTDTPIVASFEGDALYGPSEGAPQAFGAAGGLAPSALYGPTCNPATTPKPTVGCGDPVDPATGNLSLPATDLLIVGRGPALEVTRTYNAQAAANGATGRFGSGWSDAYGARVQTGPGKTVTVHLGSGATIPFRARGQRYEAPGWVTAKLERGGQRSWVLTLRDGSILRFDRRGRLSQLSDRAREPVTLGYADGGSLASATDASGRVIAFTSDAAGRPIVATDPAGRIVRYGYSPAGDLVEVTDVAGGVTRYAYDDQHRLTSVTDATGAVTTNAYDDGHRIVSQVNPAGDTLGFAYDGTAPDQATIITNGNGHRSAYQYRAGVLTSMTAGLDSDAPSTTSFVYDATLDLVATIDPLGHPWRYTRDGAGNVLSATDPLGRTTTLTWNERNDPTGITTPMGIRTRIEYDDRGLLRSVVKAVGSPDEVRTTINREDADHPSDVTAVTDALGGVTTFTRDEHGAVISATDALGGATAVTRDTLGWVETRTDPTGLVTSYEHDAFGDLVRVTDAAAGITVLGRDAARRVSSVTDALGQTTTIEHDAAGRIVSVTAADGTVLGTTYDAVGAVAAQVDEAGSAWSTGYDDQERPVAWVDPLGNSWDSTWDAAGRFATLSDPMGQETRSTWDPAGQLIALGYADDTPGVTASYDADGRRTSMTDGTGTTTFSYDALGRLTSVTDGGGRTVTTAYDAAGNNNAIGYPDGSVVAREHDQLGRLVAVRDPLGNESTFSWDAAGRLAGMRRGDGSVTTWRYDDRGDVAAIEVVAPGGSGQGLSFSYERDALGRVSRITESLDGQPVDVTRDARGRITSVGGDRFDLAATGDLLGTRGYELAYDKAGRLLAAEGPGSIAFSNDLAGQRTSSARGTDPATPYTWDAAGRLVGVGSTSHAYDGDGLRVSSSLDDGSTSTFTWLRGAGLPILLGDGSSWFIHGPDGMPLQEIRADGSVAWLHVDQAGSVRAATDEAGRVTGTVTWDAYGLPVTETGEAPSRLGFQGGYADPDTGLQYRLARFYDPATARFLSIDPLATWTRQPYAFANGDPLSFGDPSGAVGALVGGRGIPKVGDMLDALGLPEGSAAAMCALLDTSMGDVAGLLDNLTSMFEAGMGARSTGDRRPRAMVRTQLGIVEVDVEMLTQLGMPAGLATTLARELDASMGGLEGLLDNLTEMFQKGLGSKASAR